MATATRLDGLRPYTDQRRQQRGRWTIVEHYTVDGRGFDTIEAATGLPTYGDEHPTKAGTFVEDIDIIERGGVPGSGADTSVVRVTYRPPDGSGGVLVPVQAYAELEPVLETEQVLYAVDNAGVESGSDPVAQGRGMPREACRLILVTHRFFSGAVPTGISFNALAAIDPPKVNADTIVVPRVGGVNSTKTFGFTPGQMLFLGAREIDLGNGQTEFRCRFHVAPDHLYRWSTFDANMQRTGGPFAEQRYGTQNFQDFIS
ncbi:MAG: hypothetical protein AAFR96_09365 [Planctomycetota bacterium]